MLSGLKPFSRLVYPLPEKHGLGIHATLDLDGNVRFGPDTQWVSEENYDVDPARAGLFYQAVRTYYPGLPDNSLQPGYAGIRPKTTTERSARQDFRIAGPAQHGWPGLVALFGIESPGLTSCLAIAENVSTMATLKN